MRRWHGWVEVYIGIYVRCDRRRGTCPDVVSRLLADDFAAAKPSEKVVGVRPRT